MRSRPLLNLLLLVMVAGLGIWLWLSGPAQPHETAYTLISDIDPASIDHIVLARPGKPDLTLQRSGTSWQITTPITAPANPFRISSLLSLLQAPGISAASVPLKQTGLADTDHPVSLAFNRHRFRFGGISPLDHSRYVEYEGNVYLIEDTLYPQLLQDTVFFVDNAAMTPDGPRTTDGASQQN